MSKKCKNITQSCKCVFLAQLIKSYQVNKYKSLNQAGSTALVTMAIYPEWKVNSLCDTDNPDKPELTSPTHKSCFNVQAPELLFLSPHLLFVYGLWITTNGADKQGLGNDLVKHRSRRAVTYLNICSIVQPSTDTGVQIYSSNQLKRANSRSGTVQCKKYLLSSVARGEKNDRLFYELHYCGVILQ